MARKSVTDVMKMIAATVAAPAIVRADSLMKVTPFNWGMRYADVYVSDFGQFTAPANLDEIQRITEHVLQMALGEVWQKGGTPSQIYINGRLYDYR